MTIQKNQIFKIRVGQEEFQSSGQEEFDRLYEFACKISHLHKEKIYVHVLSDSETVGKPQGDPLKEYLSRNGVHEELVPKLQYHEIYNLVKCYHITK